MLIDMDRFQEAVSRIKAEQFFKEKTAKLPLDHVSAASLGITSMVEDPELLKVASIFCPKAPLKFYVEELGGTFRPIG